MNAKDFCIQNEIEIKVFDDGTEYIALSNLQKVIDALENQTDIKVKEGISTFLKLSKEIAREEKSLKDKKESLKKLQF